MSDEVSQALYRKWRPQSWDAVIGQGHVTHTLRNAIVGDKVGHAYLFAGPRGTGKTTTARLLAKAVNCTAADPAERPCDGCENCAAVREARFMDLIEIDAASNTSVEDIRSLRDKVNFKASSGGKKIYIIDEVHMLSTAAFNALLKTLEEPPPHVIFILATTDVHKIPATVLSRCQRHEFRRISVNDIVKHLGNLAQQEGISVAPEALTLIARQSTGAMRDAISLLDQLASSGQAISLEMAQDVLGAAAGQSVLEIADALVGRDAAVGLNAIHAALDAGADTHQLARQVVDYLRDLLLIVMKNAEALDAAPDMRARMAQHAQAFSSAELVRVMRLFSEAAVEARSAWQPSLPLELALAAALAPAPAAPAAPAAAAAVLKGAAAAPASPAVRTPRAAAPAPPASAPAARSPASPANKDAAQPAEVDMEAVHQATHHLNEIWQEFLSQVRQRNNALYGAVNSCKKRVMHGNKLVLFYASDVIKSKVETPENLETLSSVLQEMLGQEIRVACVIDTQARDSVPQGVDDDGMVAAALRDLGGSIAGPH